MKVGSLIELVNDNWIQRDKMIEDGVIFPVKNKIYTIREIVDCLDDSFGVYQLLIRNYTILENNI